MTEAIRKNLQSYYLGLIYENKEIQKRMRKTVNKVLNRDTNPEGVSSLEKLNKKRDTAKAVNQHTFCYGKSKNQPKKWNQRIMMTHLSKSTSQLKI